MHRHSHRPLNGYEGVCCTVVHGVSLHDKKLNYLQAKFNVRASPYFRHWTNLWPSWACSYNHRHSDRGSGEVECDFQNHWKWIFIHLDRPCLEICIFRLGCKEKVFQWVLEQHFNCSDWTGWPENTWQSQLQWLQFIVIITRPCSCYLAVLFSCMLVFNGWSLLICNAQFIIIRSLCYRG